MELYLICLQCGSTLKTPGLFCGLLTLASIQTVVH